MTSTDKAVESKSLEIVSTLNFTKNICNPSFANFHKICRFCLSFDNLKPLFGMTYQQATVQSIIFDFLLLKVEPEDSLPNNLCVACIAELIRCYNFKKRSIQVTGTLQDAYNRNFGKPKGTTSQFNISECGEMCTDNSIVKEEKIENENNVDTDNLIIKNDKTWDIQNVCDDIISDNTASADVIMNNEGIDNKPIVSNYGTSEDVKIEDIGDPLIINDNNILKDADCVNLIIMNEENGNTECIPANIMLDATTNVNVTIKTEILEDNDNDDLIVKNENIGDEPTIHNHISEGGTNGDNYSNIEIENITVNGSPDLMDENAQLCPTMLKPIKPSSGQYDSEDYSGEHLESRNPKQMYRTCKICKRRCKKDDLKQHFKRKSICRVCSQTLVEKHAHVCKCMTSFRTKAELISHMKVHTNKEPHICSICKKSFVWKSDLNTHMLVHKNRHECTLCRQSFTRKQYLNVHMQIHTSESPHKCSVCQKSFTQKFNLDRHMSIHTGEKPHKCSVCEKAFNDKYYLNEHMTIHAGEKQPECNICKKSFTRKSNLNTHMLIHIGKKPHKCGLCEKSFIQKCDLTKHMITHVGGRQHECNVCKKSFTRKCNLNMHMLIHTGEKPHKCSVCEKSFTQVSALNAHMLIHTGERPFKCSVCEKSFTQITNLNAHLSIHTGEKPHKCSVCEKSFIQKCDLNKHVLSHMDERQYECTVCMKSFIQKGHLTKHMLIHTGGKLHK